MNFAEWFALIGVGGGMMVFLGYSFYDLYKSRKYFSGKDQKQS